MDEKFLGNYVGHFITQGGQCLAIVPEKERGAV
jgi:hypothetical protein